MSKIKDLDHKNFENEISNSTLPVLVDFWAEWCGPCKTLTPILEELSLELEKKIQVAKVNLDENQDLASKFSIRSIPTLLLFKNGELIDTKIGLLPKNDLSEWIKNKIDE
ncbi:MAG: thioredoxin [Rickettsiales bacterium]|nr:thioredoxin [Rickettsiales bacterium]